MPAKSTLSPKELALAVGVSESSLKRWADRGQIRVRKTAGGHRRITLQDAVRFARELNLPIVRPDILNLPDLSRARELDLTGDRLAEVLFERLKEGRADDVQAVMLELYLQGQSVAELFDGPVREAMHRMGELWQHHEAGIFAEHRATDICIQTVNLLRSLITPAAPAPGAVREQHQRPIALGGAPAGDPYILPSLMAATVLADAGYRDVNLGANTPLPSLLAAARHYRPKLIWLSCSVAENTPSAVQLHELAVDLEPAEAPLAVGGQGFEGTSVPSTIGRVRYCETMQQLSSLARDLLGGAASEDALESLP